MTTPEARPSSQGLYKSAVLLVALGADAAAQVLSQMDERQVESLAAEITRLGRIEAQERDRVLDEFSARLAGEAEATAGGPEYARRVLEQAVGPERAQRILSGAAAEEADGASLESLLETIPPASLAALVADEHPQLIALLIGQLSVEPAAAMLAALPPELQGPVTARLTELEAPAPIALTHLARHLTEKLRGEVCVEPPPADAGPRRVADILGRMRRSVENLVLASLEEQSPTLAQKVNQYRFTFENLLELQPRTLQRVLRDVEADTLRVAMKGLDEVQQQVIYSNMSERAAARLKEDLENSGPTPLREVEAAQQAMVVTARALQESGEIQLTLGSPPEGEEEEPVV
jgi:flagellar motor switch protein FliG